MALPDHKKQFFNAVGMTAEEIAAVEAVLEANSKAASAEGLRNRELGTIPQQPVAQQPVQQVPQQPVANVDDQVKQAQDFILKALEPILVPLTAKINSLEAELLSMKQQPVQLNNTPAASLAAQSILAQQGAHIVSGRLPDKTPTENNSDKEGSPEQQALIGGTTGVPFLDNILTLNQKQRMNGFGG